MSTELAAKIEVRIRSDTKKSGRFAPRKSMKITCKNKKDMLGYVGKIADLVKRAKRHIENYKKQDNFADVTQVREGIDAIKKLNLHAAITLM